MMIAILIIFFANILWAVLNWKKEWDEVVNAYKDIKRIDAKRKFNAIFKFVCDLVITCSATGVFGFSGFYGAAGALFMSNLLSVFFFLPKKDKKLITHTE